MILSKKPVLYTAGGIIVILLGLIIAPDALPIPRILYYFLGFLFLAVGGGLWVRSINEERSRYAGLWRSLLIALLAILLVYLLRCCAPLYLFEWVLLSLACFACLLAAAFLEPFAAPWRYHNVALLVVLALLVGLALTSINGHVKSLALNTITRARKIATLDWRDVYSMEEVLSADPSGDTIIIRTTRRGGGDLYFTLDMATGEVTKGPASAPAGLTQVASPLFFLDSRDVMPFAGTKALRFVRPGVVRYEEDEAPVWEMTVNSGQYHASAMAVPYGDDTIYLFVLEEEWFPPRNTGNQLFRYHQWVVYQVITTKGN